MLQHLGRIKTTEKFGPDISSTAVKDSPWFSLPLLRNATFEIPPLNRATTRKRAHSRLTPRGPLIREHSNERRGGPGGGNKIQRGPIRYGMRIRRPLTLGART